MTDKEKELQAEAIDYYRKRIAELEQENKTVSRKANEAIADKLLITAKYNEVLNDLNQENDKLQKENAELKEELTAAKDLLKRWVDDRVYTVSEQKDLIADTEQFLEEE